MTTTHDNNAEISSADAPTSSSAAATVAGAAPAGPSKPPSSSTSLQLPAVTVVTPQRKEQLLLQARAERRNWISRVPLPYSPQARAAARGAGGGGDLQDDLWSRNDALYRVQSSLVCQRYLPSATRTLSELYGLNDASAQGIGKPTTTSTTTTTNPLRLDQVAERVQKLVSRENSCLPV